MRRNAGGIGIMRVRDSFSALRAALLSGCFVASGALVFIACGPAPVVVTDADQALVGRPKATASASSSASAVTVGTNKKTPLLVPDETLAVLPPFTCPADKQIDLLGQTFCILESARNWHDSEAFCQKIGAHLAVMKNTSVATVLRKAVGSPAGVPRFWIGLAEASEGRWVWADGTPMKFSAFRSGEPNNAGRGEDCAEWSVADGRWNDADCFQSLPFLCEAPSVAPGSRAKGMLCRGDLFKVGKTDYCLVTPTPWAVAQQTCIQDGGELAKLDSEAENTALFNQLKAKMPVGNLWIGLSDEAIEGDFRWISGDPLVKKAWRTGEPNNLGDEDCVEWVLEDGLWNDVPCSIERQALCEKPQPAVGK